MPFLLLNQQRQSTEGVHWRHEYWRHGNFVQDYYLVILTVPTLHSRITDCVFIVRMLYLSMYWLLYVLVLHFVLFLCTTAVMLCYAIICDVASGSACHFSMMSHSPNFSFSITNNFFAQAFSVSVPSALPETLCLHCEFLTFAVLTSYQSIIV